MKPSPAFTTLLHIVWGGVFGLLISGGAAISQYNSVNGINISQDVIVFCLAVLTGLGSAALSTWSNIQKSPALPIAEAEVASVLAANANTLAQQAHTRIDQVVATLQTHVHPTPVQVPQSGVVPSSLSKITLQPLPAQSTPVVASTPNVAPAGSVPLTTVPAMPVVQAQQ